MGRVCLAKYDDKLWHLATIETIDMKEICVQFKKINKIAALPWESILMIDGRDTYVEKKIQKQFRLYLKFLDFQENDTNIEFDSIDNEEEDDEEDEIISKNFEPRNLNVGFGNLGNWEKHTRVS